VILITGGTGFIGSYLIKQLLSSEKRIRSIKRSTSTIPDFLKNYSQIEWVEADVLDYFALEDAFEGVGEVYHCAAMVSYASEDKKQLMKVNVEGTTHIVNLCLEKQVKLVYVSSVAALGNNLKGKAITEKDYWEWDRHKSNYSISKYEAEREVWRGIAEGLQAVIVNPSVVIGVSHGRSESSKIFKLLEKGLNFYPSGSLGFVNVEDVVKIMIQLMAKPDAYGNAYLLNESNISYKELFLKYALLSGKPAPKYVANKSLMGIAWRLVAILKAFGIKRFELTKEIAQASVRKNSYSNKKIVETLSYSFKSLDQSLEEIHCSLQ
jgi:nucleoside-diphosphate-sugar epimerase